MKGKVSADKISLLKVKTLKSLVEAGLAFSPGHIQYDMGVTYDSGVSIEDKQLIFNIQILLNHVGENVNDSLQAEFHFQYLFQVENLEDLYKSEGGEFLIDGALTVTLIGILYSTARGLVLSNTQNVVPGGLILPVVNPSDILKDGFKGEQSTKS